MVYGGEFADSSIREYPGNIIAEIMYAQFDPYYHSHDILECKLDFKNDDKVLSSDDLYVTIKSGRCHIMKIASVWNFLIQYKDGSEELTHLEQMRDSNPLEIAEFATVKWISE